MDSTSLKDVEPTAQAQGATAAENVQPITTTTTSSTPIPMTPTIESESQEAEGPSPSPLALEELTTTVEPNSVVEPGIKDKEGFLPPPPASTLLIRRARSSSTGAPTYVISSSTSASQSSTEGTTIPDSNTTPPTPGPGPGKPGKGKNATARRRPGRPVGSIGPYKRRKEWNDGASQTPATGEIRVSSRVSTSIFKHDITGTMGTSSPTVPENSPWMFPAIFRASYSSGGKPPMTGFRKPKYSYSKGQKRDSFDNIDPLTGKRRYTRRKKTGESISREPEQELSGESDPETEATKIHLSDNGVWRPTDDLRLIVNLLASGDLESVYLGVTFSCYFSYKEIQERWRKLLYNEKSSLVAQNAISALHPDVKAKIYYESMFSPEEEKLIASIKLPSDSNPDIKSFEGLLDKNPHIFNKYRTARSLMMHWLDMKDYNLLDNQNVVDYSPYENFEDFEELICEDDEDFEDDHIEDEFVDLELKTEERNLKKKVRLVDDEIAAWQLLTDQIIDDGTKNRALPPLPNDFDSKTLALLRGKEVYYGMTSKEIILGRSTKECKVDADLTEEGASNRISRKQALIRLRPLGKFIIINKGKRTIFVDRKAVQYRCEASLHDQSIIQISQINLIFFINEPLIDKIIERDVSNEIYASFKDLEKELPSISIPRLTEASAISRRNFASPYVSTSSVLSQSHLRNATLGVGTSHCFDESYQTTHSSCMANINNIIVADVEGTFSPISEPPASYVTVTSSLKHRSE